jgi:hypothetical protein
MKMTKSQFKDSTADDLYRVWKEFHTSLDHEEINILIGEMYRIAKLKEIKEGK